MTLDIDAPPARFLEQYAKQYNAGAFATPTVKEIAANPGLIAETRDGRRGRGVVARRVLSRDSKRLDFTGAGFIIPKGAHIATHVARTDGFLPPLGRYDYVMAYAEDHDLTKHLSSYGRAVVGSRITAAAEVINCWGPIGLPGRGYLPADRATVVDLGQLADAAVWTQIQAETAQVRGWDDDFPYYSDGSWSSVSLKGFWPDEPGRGVKPAEMPKTWKIEHPEDLDRTCEWTTLAKQMPTVSWLVNEHFPATERVRLLRMTKGRLGRHTDITDRATGTRDGMIGRFHIPLVTDPSIKLTSWDIDGRMRDRHMHAGHCYYLDSRKPHAVANPVDVSRVHLVVDALMDQRLRDIVGAAWRIEQELAR